MKHNNQFIADKLNHLKGLCARNVKLGYGSFITMDFGKDIETMLKTKKGIRTKKRGEWHLWLYGCSWRINKDDNPLMGCEDNRESIERALVELENKSIVGIDLLNSGFDILIRFSENLEVVLFTNSVQEMEQWMLFTPDDNVLTVGPSNNFTYKNADEPRG